MLENGHVWRKYIYHRYREFLFRGSFNTISHLDASKFLMPHCHYRKWYKATQARKKNQGVDWPPWNTFPLANYSYLHGRLFGNTCTKHTQTHLIPGIDVAHRNVHQCCQSTPSNVWNSILFNAIYSINQQIKRNTGSKKHIGLTHLLPLFCRSLSQFHLHAANRVWLWRNTSLSARLD